jgi:hypothetical protein
MNTIEVPGNKKIFEIPAEWDELDQSQVIKILKLAMLFTSGNIDKDSMITRSFYIIARIKRNWKSVFKERLLNRSGLLQKNSNTHQAAKALTTFLFLPEDPDHPQAPTEFSFDSIKNFFPTIIADNGSVLFGPDDLLNDLTFGEFLEALNNMNEYFVSKNDDHLNNFICALYRPEQMQGIRSPLDDHYKQHSKQIKNTPAYLKYGILLWFTTCIKYIKSSSLLINGQEISLAVLFPSGGSTGGGSAGLGWTSLLYGIAKEGLFGDIRETYKSKLFDVLLFMYDNHYKQIKSKK